MSAIECDLSQEEIAGRAYEIWQARGCPSGDGTSDWEAAIAELSAKRNNNGGPLRAWLKRVRQSIVGHNN